MMAPNSKVDVERLIAEAMETTEHDTLELQAARKAALGVMLPDIDTMDISKFEMFLPSQGFSGFDAVARWIIKGVIPENSFGVVYGGSGGGKSFFAVDLACCIATGKSFMGQRTTQGSVYYLAAEGCSGVKKRIRGWSIVHHGGEDIPQMMIGGRAVDLSDPVMVRRFIAAIKHMQDLPDVEPIRLIVIDTLARCFGGEENSATAMNIAIQHCDLIRAETGASVLVVHHSGKDEDRGARGSSALRAACDFEFSVKRQASDSGIKATLKNTKAKDSEPLHDTELRYQTVELGLVDEDGEPITTLARSRQDNELRRAKADVVAPSTKSDVDQQAIIACLRRMGGSARWHGGLRDAVIDELSIDTDNINASTLTTRLSRAMTKLAVGGIVDGNIKSTEPIKLLAS